MDRQTKKTKSTKKKNARSIPKEATIVHTGSLARMDHSKKNPTNQNNTPCLEQLVDHCCSGKSIYALGTFTSKGAQVSVPPPAHLIPTHKTHL